MPADGDKTLGRQGSRANALKHGLSARLLVTDESNRLNQLIALFAPECEDKEVWHAAKQAAEAWLYCERVLRARSDVIAATTQVKRDENGASDQLSPVQLTRASERLARYERRAMKQLEGALERLQTVLFLHFRESGIAAASTGELQMEAIASML
jgi:hypothetical protein